MDNRKTLLLGSFFTLIAAGVGFSVRGAILGDWGEQFGFTQTALGQITGGGLTGFGVTIIICSLFVDQVGYKPLLVIAFLLHALSAVVTLAATPIFDSMGGLESEAARDTVYNMLYWGMFLFAIANGICETVINPLIATLYSKQKTHYLNILHAGWPAGLIVGGLFAFLFAGPSAVVKQLRWEIAMGFFLVPTLIYGWLIFKEKFPHSEARAAGVSLGKMLATFASPMLLFLMLLHAMVGYVELGTDSWITNIMERAIPSSIMLLVYTSGIMFVLRFFAGPIVEHINPIGLLLASALLGASGLFLLSNANGFALILIAATVYGVGKTFLWPTMLGVVGERFPQGGAITMGTVGGIGMLSAGMIAGPGIGWNQDYFASKQLKAEAPAVYEEFKAAEENSFPFIPGTAIQGLDGAKVGKVKEIPEAELTEADKEVLAASDYGGRMALRWTAIVPAMMAVGYLILLLYFAASGGYKQVVLHGESPDGEELTGGVEGPVA